MQNINSLISVSNITASTRPEASEKFAISTIRAVRDRKSDDKLTRVNCRDRFAKKLLFARCSIFFNLYLSKHRFSRFSLSSKLFFSSFSFFITASSSYK